MLKSILAVLIALSGMVAYGMGSRDRLKVQTTEDAAMHIAKWRVIMNWDGGPVYDMPAWMTEPGEFRTKAIDRFRAIGAAVVTYGMGCTDLVNYDSKYSECFGQYDDEYSREVLKNENKRKDKEHCDQMMREQRFPLTVLVEEGHKAGLVVLASFRMNDTHDLYYSSKTPDDGVPLARFKREHPELLIKDDQGWTKYCLDFAHAAVRERRYNQITEVVDRWLVDGVELDYMRNGFFFARGKERENAALMTDLVMRLREMLDEHGRKRGKQLYLVVHTPMTQEVSLDCGLDVEGWIRQGLVDAVVADEGCTPFSVTPSDFVRAARETGKCRVFSTIDIGLGLPERTEPEKGCNSPVSQAWTPAQLRSWAMTQREAGVDGLNIFNGHYGRTDLLLTNVFGPTKNWWDFTAKDKTFVAQNASFCANMPRKAVPKIEMLPKNIEPAKEQWIDVFVPAAMTSPPEKAALRATVLRLIFRNILPGDQLDVRFGDLALGCCIGGTPPPAGVQVSKSGNRTEVTVTVDVAKIAAGANRITVQLQRRDPAKSPPVIWNYAELQFRY
ncbi:MAG: hypothetical protein NT011_03000 [Kiritimatiellaeota bacterium]|nr:hypothetical protein [Kiritimatiellota bacterium]